MKCFYHSADLDGHSSGAIIKYAEPKVELIGYNYGQEFPWDAIDPSETVYMVDVSLPIDDMMKLARMLNEGGGRFIWIDHHVSIIRDYEALDEADRDLFDGIRETGRAACELCWDYISVPGTKTPPAIELLGIYDSWRFTPETERHVKCWQYGMRTYEDTRPESMPQIWKALLEMSANAPLFESIIKAGETIFDYQITQNAKTCRSCAFETTLYLGWEQGLCGPAKPLKCIAVNSNLMNSDVLKSIYDPETHDAMLCFYWSKRGFWRCSIYSDKEEVDCSLFAKSHGGGGHKGAAGFQGKFLPFEPFSPISKQPVQEEVTSGRG